MNNEVKIILAFLFKRSGKERVKESELFLPLSLELKWFTTKEAKEFVHTAISQNLLKKEHGLLRPTFTIQDITIPIGFYPSKQALQHQKMEESTDNIFEKIASHITQEATMDKPEVLKEIQKIAEEKQILPVVAAMQVAKQHHVDIKEYYTIIQHNILTESEE
jgi:hypothetical protein